MPTLLTTKGTTRAGTDTQLSIMYVSPRYTLKGMSKVENYPRRTITKSGKWQSANESVIAVGRQGTNPTFNVVDGGYTLNFLNHPFNIDLIPIELGSFDAIGLEELGCEVPSDHCAEKIVRIPWGNETLIVRDDRSNQVITSFGYEQEEVPEKEAFRTSAILVCMLPISHLAYDEPPAEQEENTKIDLSNYWNCLRKEGVYAKSLECEICYPSKYLEGRTPKAIRIIGTTRYTLMEIKQRIQAARDRQKSYADLKRKPMEFQVGDRVMLKVSPWKGFVLFGKRGKLNPRYIGPFKVLEQVGSIAYKLKLPQELSRVHNTFHVSNSKKCYADEPLAVPLDGLHFDDKHHFVEEQAAMWQTLKLAKRHDVARHVASKWPVNDQSTSGQRSNKVNQCIIEQIPTQKKKILGIDQLTKDTFSFGPKDLIFVKSLADNVSITDSNKPRLSETGNSTLSNHDTNKIPSVESQRNKIDPSVAITKSLVTNYNSTDESSVCSTPLPPPKKLDGVEPVSGPKTIKSILKLKSTFKAETLKGIIINEPSSAPARGNKSSSTSKTNPASAGKLKNVKIEDDPPLAIVIKELNELKLQISKKKSSYFRNKNTQQ
ncbi:hypothetical protein Tco_0714808, partial [Tanacetum coccineum]